MTRIRWGLAFAGAAWVGAQASVWAAPDTAFVRDTLARYEAKHRDEAMSSAGALVNRHDANRNGLIEWSEQSKDDPTLRIEVDDVEPGHSGTRTIRVVQVRTTITGFALIDVNQDGALSPGELAARILLDADDNRDGQLGTWDYILRGFPHLSGSHLDEEKHVLARRSDEIVAPSPSPLRPPDVRPTPPR